MSLPPLPPSLRACISASKFNCWLKAIQLDRSECEMGMRIGGGNTRSVDTKPIKEFYNLFRHEKVISMKLRAKWLQY